MISNSDRTITQFQIASIFGKAYVRVGCLKKTENPFSQTRIEPFNWDVFSEEDFVALQVTDHPEPEQAEEPDMPDEVEYIKARKTLTLKTMKYWTSDQLHSLRNVWFSHSFTK